MSALFQWAASIQRRAKAAKALRKDLGVVYRHLEASIKSLERPADVPSYQLVARLRYAMFKDSPLSPSQLEFIEETGLTEKAKVIKTWMRNSDIFLEEISERIDNLDQNERVTAMVAARDNLANLREFLDTLGLRTVALAAELPVELAQKVDKRLSDRKRHES